MDNLKTIIQASGSSLPRVVKATIFLTDMAHYATINAIYSQYFPEPCPARSCVAVTTLPRNALCEIEAIAIV